MPEKLFDVNPFPGLRSFEYEDRKLFFGREGHIQQIKNKLLQNRFLALIGTSGSGKSSLIKAGLIPALEREDDLADAEWNVLLFKPGTRPVANLHAVISAQSRDFQLPENELDSLAAEELLNRIENYFKQKTDQPILIIIDQFEELFRYTQQKTGNSPLAETDVFIDYIIRQIASETPVHIVITMRSDYLDHCTAYDGLTEVINRGNYLLPKMVSSEIRDAIVKPVTSSGAGIHENLVQRILDEINENPDHLPILQHALMRTWNRWRATSQPGAPLTLNEYEAVGTMKNAITQHAEEIYNVRLDEKKRNVAEKLFKTLITLGPADAPVVSPASVTDIVRITGLADYLLIDVIMVFREDGSSFLTPKPTIKLTPDSIIDLTVEKVLSFWDRSRGWMQEEIESAKLYKQLSYSAELYQNGKSTLWVNPELQLGLNWLRENNPTLEWARRYNPYFENAINFLRFSKKEAEEEILRNEERQKSELRRARIVAAILGISALVSLSFFIVAMVLRTQSKQSEKLALEKEVLALAERNRAEEQTYEAISQKKIAEQQGMLAELQRELTEEQKLIAVTEQEKAIRESAAALQAKKVAEEQRYEAILSRQQAEFAQGEAETQRKVAEGARQESDKQRERAVTSQKEAEMARNDALRQRAQAIARFIAIQSAQINSSDELATLLALQAYKFNAQNGGQTENPEIFRALSRVSGTKVARTGHKDIVRTGAVILHEQRNWFVSGADDGEIRIWDIDQPASIPLVLNESGKTQKTGVRAVTFAENQRTVITGHADGQILKWEINNNKATSRTIGTHPGPISGLYTFGANQNKRLVSIDQGGTVRTWALAGNSTPVSTTELKTKIAGSTLSRDQQYLFAGSTGGGIIRVPLANPNEKIETYPLLSDGFTISTIGISPDGNQMYVGSSRGDIMKLELRNNAPSGRGNYLLRGAHSSAIRRIAFSPDGSRMATAGYDWKIKIYNLKEDLGRQQPVTLDDFDFWVMDLNFSGDGRTLIAGGADKTIRSWEISSEELYKSLLKKARRNLTEEEWDKYVGKDIPFEGIVKANSS